MTPLTGRIYRHYKNQLYKIIAISRSTDKPSEKFVVYEAQYTDPMFGKNCIWCRSLLEFNQPVLVENKPVPRFILHEAPPTDSSKK